MLFLPVHPGKRHHLRGKLPKPSLQLVCECRAPKQVAAPRSDQGKHALPGFGFWWIPDPLGTVVEEDAKMTDSGNQIYWAQVFQNKSKRSLISLVIYFEDWCFSPPQDYDYFMLEELKA